VLGAIERQQTAVSSQQSAVGSRQSRSETMKQMLAVGSMLAVLVSFVVHA